MTTSPVMSINDELLADLQQKAKAAIDSRPQIDTPSAAYAAHMARFRSVATPDAVSALVEHIRSLTARMSYIERNFVGATFDYDGDGMAAMVVRISDRVSVCRDAMAVLDAAIAQEGKSHE